MRRGVVVLALLVALSACTDGNSAGSTTTLMPIEGDPRYPTAVSSTATTTVPVTTTVPAERPKGTGWAPPEGLSDEQLKAVAVAVAREYNEGAGSEDPVLVNKALRASTSEAHNDVVQLQKELKAKNQGDRGELFIYGGPQSWQVSPSRSVIRFVLCIRDNIARTDLNTGQIVSQYPLPRPVGRISVGMRITPDPDPIDGSAPGNYWKLVAQGSADPEEATCPS